MIICLGPICIPIWGLLPLLLLWAKKIWDWFTGANATNVNANATNANATDTPTPTPTTEGSPAVSSAPASASPSSVSALHTPVVHKEIAEDEPSCAETPEPAAALDGLRRRRAVGGSDSRPVGVLRDEEHLSELRAESASTGIPLIMYFTAPWCQPCKTITPAVEEQSAARDATFVKVDVDEHSDLALLLDVPCLPSFVAARGEKELGRCIGASLHSFNDFLDRVAPQQ